MEERQMVVGRMNKDRFARNPDGSVKIDDQGYEIHILDGVECGGYWTWIRNLMHKYGFDVYDPVEGMCPVRFMGETVAEVNDDIIDEYEMGLADAVLAFWEMDMPTPADIKHARSGPTGSSNRTITIKG